jgi:hypothetical protein
MSKRFTIYLALISVVAIIIINPFGLFGFQGLSSPSKCRQIEALTYIGIINRAQQAYFLEKNKFTDTLSDIGLGIASQSKDYDYSISVNADSVFNYGRSRLGAAPTCESKCTLGIPNPFYDSRIGRCRHQYPICLQEIQICTVRNYVGVVYLKKPNNSDSPTNAILCESKDKEISQPIWQNGEYVCGQNSEQIK